MVKGNSNNMDVNPELEPVENDAKPEAPEPEQPLKKLKVEEPKTSTEIPEGEGKEKKGGKDKPAEEKKGERERKKEGEEKQEEVRVDKKEEQGEEPKKNLKKQTKKKKKKGGDGGTVQGKKEEAGEKQEDVGKGKKEEQVEEPKKNLKKTEKTKKKKGEGEGTVQGGNGKTADGNMENSKGKSESMGMIFMCNAQTKKDCFTYKVLGLPGSKKELVAKVYKGMRLFLFDVDLRLMYGIYKASGRGGYNIEPKAFKSGFPSQVRFTVLNDCLPLPEEKFKAAIKSNYYTKNKFNVELTSEQVKNLCKLFKPANIGPSKPIWESRRPRSKEVHDLVERGRNRRQAPRDRRQSPWIVDDRLPPVEHVAYEREVYAPPPPPEPYYAYERPIELGYYEREPPIVGFRDRRLPELRREEIGHRDLYLHREPELRREEIGHRALYLHREPELRREEIGYRDPYLHGEPVVYHHSSYQPPIYRY
ncbi:uncharacterized protein LOC18436138 [Amborella trichopoda]|uniref:DCD domain-containing protein n=1 Tax=Amborella trichopoda TaxID=13333 RepID=W1PJI3_AMBTC|nr:uncharacterized protein LOC18436138 [Amborella trichopoda]ERN07899.1 hypothetical protein AMTR_s00012p00232000 [Amborella trichopoda]|eukprot:XP_006846224.1 uncharacterized protein LOC18436138 [Amborella trichopoda]